MVQIVIVVLTKRFLFLSTPIVSLPAALLAGALICTPVAAQDWSGGVGVGYVWQSSDGNLDNFLTQTNLQSGFVLENLDVSYRADDSTVSDFTIEAWGFGDAEPAEAVRFNLGFNGNFSLFADYDKRDSFFSLAGNDLTDLSDDWSITRWKAGIVVEAWRPVRFELFYRSVSRSGTVFRPMYGLNELYPIGVNLDDTMDEVVFRLSTRTLPVRIDFEQGFANYEQKSRRFAAGSESIGRPDPDLLDETTSNYTDAQDNVPTSRLTVGYSGGIFEGIVSLLYRKAELASSGTGSQAFLIGGGDTGTMTFVDTLLGSADTEAFAGNIALGFSIGRRFSIRLAGDYRDSTSNSTLLGERLLRIANPALGTSLDYTAPIDEDGIFNYTDSDARITLEYRAPTWAVWAGGLSTSREVDWRLTTDADQVITDRDGSGLLAGVSFNPGRHFGLSLEYERGDFTKFVFRTDPETVDRAVLRLRSKLGKGWQLTANGRYEQATNPDGVSALDFKSTPYGVAINWNSQNGASSFGLDLEQYTITSTVGLVLPGGDPGQSDYELDLTSATLFGGTRAGIFGVDGSLTLMKDNGETWPLDAWNGRVRLTLYGKSGLQYSAFAQYWSYDEGRASIDDFDVLRYGLAIQWRFE